VAGWRSFFPLVVVGDPAEVWSVQPTFLIAEGLFLVLALWGVIDAMRRQRGGLTFLAALVGGSAIELVTIMHEEVGNFYHSQATIMLFGRREPAYMLLGCYGWIGYITLSLSRKLGGSALSQAAFAALLGSEAWAVLDTVGAQFLWWTWHSSEPLYVDREGGVPIASSFWIMASMGAIALCLRSSPNHPLLGFVIGPFATVVLMNIPFLTIFHPVVTIAGMHATYAHWTFRALCCTPLISRLARPRPDKQMLFQMILFVGVITGIALLADPTKEIRTSFSQPCAPKCSVDESSFWGGFSRKAYVCKSTNSPSRDLYRICDMRCDKKGETPLDFYSSCGTPPGEGWHLLVIAHALAALLLSLVPFTRVASSPEGAELQRGSTRIDMSKYSVFEGRETSSAPDKPGQQRAVPQSKVDMSKYAVFEGKEDPSSPQKQKKPATPVKQTSKVDMNKYNSIWSGGDPASPEKAKEMLPAQKSLFHFG